MQTTITKYKSFGQIDLPSRTWPNQIIQTPPRWCSVDLRDGNQALIDPMTLQQKLDMFKMLVDIGFKEIEVGFPSAAEVEFEFVRKLIDDDLIPNDVTIQILCQARKHLIERSFEAIQGAKNAVFHIYNSTSVGQRKIVFDKSKAEIIDIALKGVQDIIDLQKSFTGNLTLEYSPESFTQTELDFAKEICDAVVELYLPHTTNKIIINLPATVEVSTPNIYADMMEWMSTNLNRRDRIVLSAHAHNDRGTAVAATELALMGGTDRVEGVLLGNGERTGNVDLVTLALNMYTQGVHPNLDFSQIDKVIECVEQCTNISTHIRHPYVGELVYTAFSGSHQDAIKKGMRYTQDKQDDLWEVPYLPIDPADLGRTYEDIIRINSQSGKGGAAYLLETEYGFKIPKAMEPEFGAIVQIYTDKIGKVVTKGEIFTLFNERYFNIEEHISYVDFKILSGDSEELECEIEFLLFGEKKTSVGVGNGPISACKDAVSKIYPKKFKLIDYSEHSLGTSSSAEAIAYVQLQDMETSKKLYGLGKDFNTSKSAIKAMFASLNLLFA